MAHIMAPRSYRLGAIILRALPGLRDLADPLLGDFIVNQARTLVFRCLVADPALTLLGQIESQRSLFLIQTGVGSSLGSRRLPIFLGARSRLGSPSFGNTGFLRPGFARCRRRTLFALFVLAEVVPHRDADLLQRLLPDPRNLFQLLWSHVRQRFDGGDAGRNQLLDNL